MNNSLFFRGLQSLLRHGDRNSMAFSIENRVPFLTIPIVEFLNTLPEQFLISNDGLTKNVFREAMRGIMPDKHIDRIDKIGFTTPEKSWLISELDIITDFIEKGPKIPFIKSEKMIEELKKNIDKRRKIDSRVWRWVNYIKWYEIMNVKVN